MNAIEPKYIFAGHHGSMRSANKSESMSESLVNQIGLNSTRLIPHKFMRNQSGGT